MLSREVRASASNELGPPEAVREESARTVIRPSSGWRALDVAELWRYRELIYFLAWRDVKVRYKQTALGVAWAVLQPALATAIFTIFLGRLAHFSSEGVPYPVFAYTALLPWTYFANALTNASSSLVKNTDLISKVYFPRLVIPLAAVVGGLVDLAIGFALLIPLFAFYHVVPTWRLLLIPIFIVFLVVTALAVSVWFAALDVQYRDVRYALPFLVQVWLFATPIVYPATVVASRFRGLYGLNPMAGVIEGFRWSLLGHAPPSVALILVSAAVVMLVLFGGLHYFRRLERRFADVI
jgi:homopolymeric O-antigen transport system permease protein